MENLAEILETEFKKAFKVKNEKALHNFITILVDKISQLEEMDREFIELSNEIKLNCEAVKKNFKN